MTVDWRNALPEAEQAAYAGAGYGRALVPSGLVATLIVDVTYGFVGRAELSDHDNWKRYPNWCGQVAREAVTSLTRLVSESTNTGMPIVQTADVSTSDAKGVWSAKRSNLCINAADESTVITEIAGSQAQLITKRAPSAFFETGLANYLGDRGVKDVLVAGCTTSGCVRATVVDAFSLGMNVFVVEEAVFDRAPTSHSVSLYEMNQKYASVIDMASAIKILREAVITPTESK